MNRGFEKIKDVRHKTQFGSGAHKQCTAKNRKTKLQCKNPAAYGMPVCCSHGARPPEARRGRNSSELTRGVGLPLVTPERAERRYLASLAFCEAINDEVSKYHPTAVKEIDREERVGARGRKIHDLLNRDLRR